MPGCAPSWTSMASATNSIPPPRPTNPAASTRPCCASWLAYDKVMAVMLPTLGEERQETYSPFLPVSPRSGKVLLAKVVDRDVARGTITYVEEDGTRDGSHHRRPLQAAMEAGHGHALGGAGRRLRDVRQGPSQPGAALQRHLQIAGGTPPEQYMYEMFLDDSRARKFPNPRATAFPSTTG